MPEVPKPPSKVVPPKPPQKGAGSVGAGEPVTGLRVSLMPVEAGAAKPGSRLAIVAGAVIVIELLLLGGAFAGLSFVIKSRQATSDQLAAEVEASKQEVRKIQTTTQEAGAFGQRVESLRVRLDEHLYWTVLFDQIERSTRPNITYLSFAGDASTSSVTMEASARGYRDIAEQIVLLRSNPLVVDVRASSAVTVISSEGEITGVTFTLLAKFKPEAWKKPAVVVKGQ